MAERTFFVRVNLDDMAAEIIGLDSTDERGLWLEGFVVGSRGKDCREEWPAAKLEGHSFGLRCFNEAEEFREKQSAKGLASVEARRNRSATAALHGFNHGSTTVQPDANQTSTYPTSNNQQPTTNNENKKKARQAAFIPPSESEWVAYCTSTWPEWSSTTAAEAWAYYESKKWKGYSDWRKVAVTAHGKARDWGTLQPKFAPRDFRQTVQEAKIVCRPGELDGIDLESVGRL